MKEEVKEIVEEVIDEIKNKMTKNDSIFLE